MTHETVFYFYKQRQASCLAIRRVKGSHTYDVLAKILEEIHDDFRIGSKITATITDSGSNFVKAFKLFGVSALPSANVLPGITLDLEFSSFKISLIFLLSFCYCSWVDT